MASVSVGAEMVQLESEKNAVVPLVELKAIVVFDATAALLPLTSRVTRLTALEQRLFATVCTPLEMKSCEGPGMTVASCVPAPSPVALAVNVGVPPLMSVK